MSFPTRQYDVIVAGGGPAGAAVATLSARAGLSVLLLERSSVPAFKIGESLMPATYWTLERMGVLERMKASSFPKKLSVQFFSPSGKGSTPFYFFETDEHESSQTWQVLRSEFDELLLTAAREAGAEVRRGVAVRSVRFDGRRAIGVVAQATGEETVELDARVVVDATGQSALLARRLRLIEEDSALRKTSFFTHYEGARRDEGHDAGATLILHTESRRAWFWSIPLPGDRVSVGVVGSLEHLVKDRAGTPREIFEEELRACPALARRLEGARQAMPVKAIRDFSYRVRELAGDGWVVVGDAGGFIDPIYSSGIFLALKSGEMAADAIVAALAEGEPTGQALSSFAATYRAGVDALRRLVYAFYDENFSFGRFLARYPERRGDLVDMLVGKVFDRPMDGFLRDLAAMVDEVPVETAAP